MHLAQQLLEKGFDKDHVIRILKNLAGSPDSTFEKEMAAIIPLDIRIKFLDEGLDIVENYK